MGIDGIGNPADASISGLMAQSARIKTIAANIANSSTPGYRRREVVLAGAADDLRVQISKIAQDLDVEPLYKPDDPDADKDGFVSNVQLPMEMMYLVSASRAYQANAAALKRYQEMIDTTIELLR